MPALADARDRPVALITMPFASAASPSLQLGVLKPLVAAQGFPVRTFHFNLDFAAMLGVEPYELLCDFGRQPVGDWLFSADAFRDDAPDIEGRLPDDHPIEVGRLLRALRLSPDQLRSLRLELVPRYLDWLTKLVDWSAYAVVGFTTTFQQNAASLALARRIKEVAPDVCIVFGGANVEDEMGLELLRFATWVELAVVGEGDVALRELLVALAEGGDPLAVPGVAGRRDGRVVRPRPRPLFRDLDHLPTPDFDEFFERARVLRLPARGRVTLPFESSRGCWWGQKHHCTFCGLNGSSMAFRAKSPTRVERELDELVELYDTTSFAAVDNIMSMDYLRTLVPRLSTRRTRLEIFYELKANLAPNEVRLLAEAGIRQIQPGIESLSTRVLRLMRKGVSAGQNVNLLRWCRYYGVKVHWNVLFGFPHESEGDYAEQAALMSMLSHLQPPGCADRLWMERFSPLFADRDRFPTSRLAPQDGYRYVYPESADLARLAYFFEYEFEDALPDAAFDGVRETVSRWQAAWRHDPLPWLEHESDGRTVRVTDGRQVASVESYVLEGFEALVYRQLVDRPVTLGALARGCAPETPMRLGEAVEALAERRLVMRDGERLLGLSVPRTNGGEPA